MDLNNLVNEQMKRLVDDGIVEKMVKEKLEETVKDAVNDLLRPYSDFGKELRKAVAESVKVNFNNLKLPTYNQMILDEVQKSVDLNIREGGLGEVKRTLVEILDNTPKEFNLSEILDTFKDEIIDGYDWEEDDDNLGDEITLHIEHDKSLYTSNSYTHIYFDVLEDLQKYKCRYQIDLHNGIIYSVKIDGSEYKPRYIYNGLAKLETLLFKIHSSGAKIVLDKGDNPNYYDTELAREDEE